MDSEGRRGGRREREKVRIWRERDSQRMRIRRDVDRERERKRGREDRMERCIENEGRVI